MATEWPGSPVEPTEDSHGNAEVSTRRISGTAQLWLRTHSHALLGLVFCKQGPSHGAGFPAFYAVKIWSMRWREAVGKWRWLESSPQWFP